MFSKKVVVFWNARYEISKHCEETQFKNVLFL
jgi:hypothetical protein